MKKLLSILIATFFLSNIVTYAQKENNPFTEIALTQAKRKDPKTVFITIEQPKLIRNIRV